MKKRGLVFLVLLTMVMSLFVGCSENAEKDGETGEGTTTVTPETTAATTSESSEATTPETFLFTDSYGREVEVPKNITRFAPSGNSAQIVLFALAPDSFVGLSSQWSSNADLYMDAKYLKLPVLGQFYGKSDLNMEEVLLSDPQVIIDIGEKKPEGAADMDAVMEQLNIPTVFIETSLSGMGETYRMLGTLLGMPEEAKKLAVYCDTIYQDIEKTMESIAAEDRAKVILVVGEEGQNVIGKGSYHSELLDIMAENVAVFENPSSKGTGDTVSMEQLLLWEPETILFSSEGAAFADDPAWQQLQAVKNKSYYVMPEGPYNWMGFPPSVNRYLGLMWTGKILYPDHFTFDLYEKAAEYYQLFYHCDLSKEQYQTLVGDKVQ